MKQNQIRIIGGRWRSRRISFPDAVDLRPSGDRIRETLFNWLQNSIQDAHCLDLFSGSGILGFEALSRGAAQVTLVDKNPDVVRHLHHTVQQLSAGGVSILQAEVPSDSILRQCPNAPFNIVFVDPPFHQGLIKTTCEWLHSSSLLAPEALIYLEAEQSLGPLQLPGRWSLIKSKVTGQVGYHLACASD